MIVLIGIGLLAGLVTAISPCVLPVLPILLAGGATGRKPLRIVAGLITSFTIFTLFSAWLLNKLGLPEDLLRNIAIRVALPGRGDATDPAAGGFARAAVRKVDTLPRRWRRLCPRRLARACLRAVRGDRFSLRSPSSPRRTTSAGAAVVLTLSYAVGAAIPMLLIAMGGRELGTRLRVQGPRLRIASGVIIGVVALGLP